MIPRQAKRTALVFAWVVACVFGLPALEVGDGAPKFVNPGLDGDYVFSRDILGSGWVLLDFFATDCEGCKKEMPELENLLEEFSGQGFRIVVFATDRDRALVKTYFEEHPTATTVVIDPYQVATENYGVEEIPAVFLVSPDGDIAYRAVGYREETVVELAEMLKGALETQ